MPVYEYRSLRFNIADNDSEYKGYFDAAKEHKLVVRKCLDCNLLRGEPGHACPWCQSLNWEWHEVSGKGTIYSYQIVAHTVLPGLYWLDSSVTLLYTQLCNTRKSCLTKNKSL